MKKHAISPVIGIILLTAVTVALVSLATFFVFDIGQSSSSGVGAATVDAEYESESKIDIQLLKQSSADRVIVKSSLGTEYILEGSGDSVTLLNQESNGTPIVLTEVDGKRTVLKEVPPQSFSPDAIVSKDSTGQYQSISTALADAEPSDIIVLKKGVYYENIEISTSNVTLVGESGTVIADNGSDSSVIDIQSPDVRVSNIRVNASSSQSGSVAKYGISSSGTATIVDVTVTNASDSSTTGDVFTKQTSSLVPPRQLDSNPIVPSGVSLTWIRSYDNGGVDISDGAEIGPKGNFYVGGYSVKDGDQDYYVRKYSPSGTLLWATRVDEGDTDRMRDIAVSKDGLVYATGYSREAGDWDYFTVKYYENGSVAWKERKNTTSNDFATEVEVDGNSDVIVTGYRDNGDDDYYTIKYDETGTKIWSRVLDVAGGQDTAYGLDVDNEDNIYITGRSYKDGDDDYYTLKYTNSGTKKWTRRYDNGDSDAAFALESTNNGTVFVTGESRSGVNLDYTTIRYESDGVRTWVDRYNGTNTDLGRSIDVGPLGNVYVTGLTEKDGDYDILTLRYTASGSQSLKKIYTSNGTDDWGVSIAIDGNSNIYIAGMSEQQTRNATALKYSG